MASLYFCDILKVTPIFHGLVRGHQPHGAARLSGSTERVWARSQHSQRWRIKNQVEKSFGGRSGESLGDIGWLLESHLYTHVDSSEEPYVFWGGVHDHRLNETRRPAGFENCNMSVPFTREPLFPLMNGGPCVT